MIIQAQNNQLSTVTENKNLISKTMRSTDNKEVTFSYLPEDKIEISVKSDLSESRKVKSHDIPRDLKGLSSPSEFHAFLKNAYVKANELSNGDVKISVSQKILGGMFRGNVNIQGNVGANDSQIIEKAAKSTSGHNSGSINPKGKGDGKSGGHGGVGAGVGVGRGGQQAGTNMSNSGNFKGNINVPGASNKR